MAKKPILKLPKLTKNAKAEIVQDEDQMVGEVDEFLDEDKPHERLPVKIRIGESIQEAKEEGIEFVEDQDEIAPWEEGFASGADHEGEGGKCARCGKVLNDKPEDVYEREIHEEIYLFCCEKCARAGPRDQHSRQE